MDEKLSNILNELKSVRMQLPVAQCLPGDQAIDEYEALVGVSFPTDYREFLKSASDSLHNGKAALRITETRDHSRELLDGIREARANGVPFDWLPFCEDNGNYFCILPDGTIRFWDHDGPSSESWPNLATWIKEVWIEGN